MTDINNKNSERIMNFGSWECDFYPFALAMLSVMTIALSLCSIALSAGNLNGMDYSHTVGFVLAIFAVLVIMDFICILSFCKGLVMRHKLRNESVCNGDLLCELAKLIMHLFSHMIVFYTILALLAGAVFLYYT